MAADIYTPNLLDCSSRLYHDEMMSKIPGAVPVSTQRSREVWTGLTKTGLEDTNEDAQGHKMVEMIDCSHGTCQATPYRHDSGEI